MTKLSKARIDGFRVVLLTAPGEPDVAMWRDTESSKTVDPCAIDVFKAARIVGDTMDFLERQLELETAKASGWEPSDG